MRRTRRRWWTWSVTAAAVLIVLGALVSALFQFAVMALPGYQDDIANTVSRAVGRPIDIGGITLGWRGLAPRLDLTDITLYNDDGDEAALTAQRLSLGFGLWRLVRGDITPSRLDLSGLRLGIAVDESGKITLRGLDTSGAPRSREDWLRDLSRFQRIRLRDCEVEVENAQLGGITERFRLLSAEVEHSRHGAEASADLLLPPDIGSGAELSAEVVGDLTRPQTWSGGWRISVSNFAGSPWLHKLLTPDTRLHFGGAEVALSGDLDGGRTDTMRLQFTADAITASHGRQQAQLTKPVLNAAVKLHDDGWFAEIKRFSVSGADGDWPQAPSTMKYQRLADEGSARGYQIESSAGFLRVQDLAPWLAMLPSALQPASGSSSRLLAARGDLRGLVLRLRQVEGEAPVYSLRADLAGFGLAADGDHPGFSGLSGEVSATENGGRLKLTPAPFTLQFGQVFEQPAAFEQLGGELSWTRKLEGWQLQAPALNWQLAGSRGDVNMDLFIPKALESSPQLRLAAQFSAEDVLRLKPYMPVHWRASLREWLDRAVVAGQVSQGRLKIEGALADFPYQDKPGVFALDLDMKDAALAFLPTWPQAEQFTARLKFRGSSLEIIADSGQLLGNRVERVRAEIADFHDPLLMIDGQAQGAVPKLYEVLRASPLAPHFSGLLDHTTAEGSARLELHLEIPLHDALPVSYAGSVTLDQVELQYHGLAEPLRGISGKVSFDKTGISSDQLAAQFFESPLTAAITPQNGGGLLTADFDFSPDAAGNGVSSLLPAIVRTPLGGSSHWQAQFDIGDGEPPVLRLRSSLAGTTVALPAPLGKPAETTAPIEVSIFGSKDFPLQIGVDYRERLGGDLRFADADGKFGLRRGLLRIGAGPAPVSQQEGFFITGSISDLDPQIWGAALAGDGRNQGPPLLRQAELQVAHLRLGRNSVNNVLLNLRPEGAGWNAKLSGDGGDGELRWQGGATGRVDARFKRLKLVADSKREDAADGVDGAPLDPTQLPTIDFACEDLQLGKAGLGRVEFTSRRIQDGQQIERLSVAGGETALQAQGQWRRAAGLSNGELHFKLDTRNIGGALDGLGFAPNLAAQRSRIAGDLLWTPDAQGIRWAQAAGKITLEFEKGALNAVEPGAGRVLGLFNFTALPRRLTLDFRDVVDKGLAFDRITGGFTLAGGNATTDNVDIVNPSLKMEMRGRVGLAARDYDQHVTVYPDVSSGLTIGALLLGGPAAGLIALIAQEVLDGPADKMSQFSYQVTGSWDNPQVRRPGQNGG